MLVTERIRDLSQKYESGSQKRTRREEREAKSKKFESKCKKISQFFPNVNEQLADPTSIQSLSYDNQAVEAMNLENAAEQTFDTALHTESANTGVNDVNESMLTSTYVTENNRNDPALWENIDDDFCKQISVLLFPKERIVMALTVISKKNISTEF